MLKFCLFIPHLMRKKTKTPQAVLRNTVCGGLYLTLDDLQHGAGGFAQRMVIGAQNAGGMDDTGLQTHNTDGVQHHLGRGCFAQRVSANHLLGITGVNLETSVIGVPWGCSGMAPVEET